MTALCHVCVADRRSADDSDGRRVRGSRHDSSDGGVQCRHARALSKPIGQ